MSHGTSMEAAIAPGTCTTQHRSDCQAGIASDPQHRLALRRTMDRSARRRGFGAVRGGRREKMGSSGSKLSVSSSSTGELADACT